MEIFDAIIIGSGQAGNPLAADLAHAGWKTALIEEAHYGGTCINDGCTPTKTLIASARVAHVVRRAADFGIRSSEPTIDFHAVIARKDTIVRDWSNRQKGRLEANENITLFFGHASFTASHSIEVTTDSGTREIQGKKIFINTGGRPAMPRFPGADSITILNSTTVMELNELPNHLAIVGGGYVGLEFGQFFLRLGSKVTIIEAGTKLLAREDRDVADAIRDVLSEEGMVFHVGSSVESAASGGPVRLKLSDGTAIDCSHVLYAAGRVPNSDTLGLAAAGIETNERGYIRVTPKLETNVRDVYALGDVAGSPAFTHIAYDDYRIIRDNLLHGASRTTTGRLVPNVTYIDPQLGRIGLSEEEAKARGLKYRVASMPMSHVARAAEVDEKRGLMKAVIAEDDTILGAAIFGMEGGEIMTMIELAMIAGMKTATLRNAIFAHPTLAESLNNLFA